MIVTLTLINLCHAKMTDYRNLIPNWCRLQKKWPRRPSKDNKRFETKSTHMTKQSQSKKTLPAYQTKEWWKKPWVSLTYTTYSTSQQICAKFSVFCSFHPYLPMYLDSFVDVIYVLWFTHSLSILKNPLLNTRMYFGPKLMTHTVHKKVIIVEKFQFDQKICGGIDQTGFCMEDNYNPFLFRK